MSEMSQDQDGGVRITRSRSRGVSAPGVDVVAQAASHASMATSSSNAGMPQSLNADQIKPLPSSLLRIHTSLSTRNHSLLLRKQQLLRSTCLTTSETPAITSAINATLVFAAHQAGTAVCICADGLLLTASHCVAETPEELAEAKQDPAWLLFSDGRAVCARPLLWDPYRDLVLLRVTHAQIADNHSNDQMTFPFVLTASTPAPRNTRLVCIGHPGSEDLEAPASSTGKLKATGYDVLTVSKGRYRGMQEDQDPEDNSDIGALKHDCWTYWGHSGAPLVVDFQGNGRKGKETAERKGSKEGELMGLHSSWDEETGMRRGVGSEALQGFLAHWQTMMGEGREDAGRTMEIVDFGGH